MSYPANPFPSLFFQGDGGRSGGLVRTGDKDRCHAQDQKTRVQLRSRLDKPLFREACAAREEAHS